MNRERDLEEQYLEDDYAAGRLTLDEFNEAIRELNRSYRDAAEEYARQAYDDAINSW